MPQIQSLNVAGLRTYPNPLSLPAGTLLACSNYLCRREGVLELRPGLPLTGSGLSAGDGIGRIFNYSSSLMAWDILTTNRFYYSTNSGSTWTALSGAYSRVSTATQIHGVEANQNFYATTSSGVQRIVNTNAAVAAGMFPGLDLKAALVTTGSGSQSGFLPGNSQVAYRCLWGIKDANNNVIKGAPSGRGVVVSQSATAAAAGLSRGGAMAAPVLVDLGAGTGNLAAATAYYYKTVATFGASQTVPFTLVSTEATITTGAGALHGVSLTWTAVNGATGYLIYRGTASNGELLLATITSGATVTYNDTTATVPAGAMPTTSTLVVATFTSHPFINGDYIVQSPGELNFPTGTANGTVYTVLGSSTTTIYYSDGNAAGAQTSAIPETFYFTTRNTTIDFTIPAAATTSHFVQVYRSFASADSSIEPDDDLQLIYEASPPAAVTGVNLTRTSNVVTATKNAHGFAVGQVVNHTTTATGFAAGLKTVATVPGANSFTYNETAANAGPTGATETFTAVTMIFTDNIPQALMGAALYSNPSQEGILQANQPPPLSWDLELYKGSMFYANTTAKQRQTFNFISVGGTAGLISGETLTIAGVTYTAGAAESAATNTFLLDTTMTPALNVQSTANSLIRVINRSLSNTTIYAFYLSADNDVPGQILLEARAFGASTFTLASNSANKGVCFSPPLTSSQSSTTEAKLNAVYFSKSAQPDAVPLTNYLLVGAANKNILRIKATRDSMFIFKDDGLFRIVGSGPFDFRVEPFDETCKLVAPESVARLSNSIYCFAQQGICTVSETGVAVISNDIADVFTAVLTTPTALTAVTRYTFGFAYESAHEYYIVTPKRSTSNNFTTADTFSQGAVWYVFNAITQKWATGKIAINANNDYALSCGIVDSVANKFTLGITGNGDDAFPRQERKTGNGIDYSEDAFAVSVDQTNAQTGALVISYSNNYAPAVGDVIVDQFGAVWLVTAVADSNNITVSNGSPSGSASLGPGTAYVSYTASFSLSPATVAPTDLQRFQELALMVSNPPQTISFTYLTEAGSASSSTSQTITVSNGALSSTKTIIRDSVPANQQASTLRLSVSSRQAALAFTINGVKFRLADDVSSRGATR